MSRTVLLKHNPPIKARCIRAYGVTPYLSESNVYEVTETYVDCGVMYYLIPAINPLDGFLAERFALMVETRVGKGDANVPPTPQGLITQSFDFDAYNSLRGLPGRKMT